MLTRNEAVDVVVRALEERSKGRPLGDPYVLCDAGAIEREFGWAFFYTSKKYLDTRDPQYQLFGNGPIIVNRRSGAIEFFGTSMAPLDIIADYERRERKRGHQNRKGAITDIRT
jgi:hypothetical protein